MVSNRKAGKCTTGGSEIWAQGKKRIYGVLGVLQNRNISRPEFDKDSVRIATGGGQRLYEIPAVYDVCTRLG